jgi:hypothetical protein
MELIDFFEVIVNLEPRPRRELEDFGAIWPSFKMVKAMLDGVGITLF